MGRSIDDGSHAVTAITSRDVPASPEKVAHADIALGFIENHERIHYTEAQERSVLRKIDKHLMPLMFLTYMIQYMDKNMMSQSSIYGLLTDLHLEGQDYSWLSSIFYFGYLAAQPFASLLLTYVKLNRLVFGISLFWAIVLFSAAGCTNFSGMAAQRFFLGFVEGGISPCYVLLTGSWYKRDEIPFRMTIWFAGNGVAVLIQGLISYGIGHINVSGMSPWKWFFIIFGIVGLLWSVVIYFWMPDTILDAKFLTEEEKMIAVERIRRNRTGISNPEFKWNQFREALLDIKVWWSFIYSIIWIIPTVAVSSFGAIIVKGFGFSTFEASLLNMPLGVTEVAGLLIAGVVTAYYPNTRCIMQVVVTIPALIGMAMVYALPSTHLVARLIGFYLTNFTIGSLVMLWAMTQSNIAGHTKRTVSTAIMLIGYSGGLLIGPQLFLGSEAPTYPTAFKLMVIFTAIATVMPIGYYVGITWLNRSRAKQLQASGQTDVFVRNEEFFDLTDKEQIHFVYIK